MPDCRRKRGSDERCSFEDDAQSERVLCAQRSRYVGDEGGDEECAGDGEAADKRVLQVRRSRECAILDIVGEKNTVTLVALLLSCSCIQFLRGLRC